ncbi:MAG: AhpC/TSA family protein [Planctomycetaceae bacterium]|nr:AhpC/TSA family protein [Planctomycetaceae bacterium]
MQLQPIDWKSHNVSIVIVSFEEEQYVRRYRDETGLKWPLISDPNRALYRLFGMERAKVGQIINWRSLRGYLKLVFKSRRKVQLPSNHDYLQLGGDIVIDPKGIVQLAHYSSSPEDRPLLSDMLRLLKIEEKVDS